MLHLIPRPLARLALRAAHSLRVLYWRKLRPRIAGVRIIALDGEDRVLLIRHTYGARGWTPPGGGLNRGEDPLRAAQREMAEELGCGLEAPHLQAIVTEGLHGAVNQVHIVCGTIAGTPRADGREVALHGLFAPDALPAGLSPIMQKGLPGWITAAIAARHRDAVAAPSPPPAPKA